MFPLNSATLPRSAEELASALEESFRRVAVVPGKVVSVEGHAYPQLDEIRVTLDGAELNRDAPRPPRAIDEGRPALRVSRLILSGQRMSIEGASVNLSLDAKDVDLHASTDRDGNVVLLLHRAMNGNIDILCAQRDLETLVGRAASHEARKHGVTLEDVKLDIRSVGPRSLEGEVRVRARKMLFNALVKIDARLDVDDNLVAKVSGLKCTGEGGLGAMACGILGPHLERANHREFSLMALPLGEVKLRDVQIAAGENVQITARFGSAV